MEMCRMDEMNDAIDLFGFVFSFREKKGLKRKKEIPASLNLHFSTDWDW